MKTIAYLMYGARREYHLELTLSVASAIKHTRADGSDIKIVMICDEANARHDLPVDLIIFNETQFCEWTENGTYTHAAKLNALLLALRTLNGQVALIDTDTVFLDHPQRVFDRIGPGRSAMHVHEKPIGESPVWQPLLDSAPAQVEGFAIDASSAMNNSGVIGVNSKDIGLIEEALKLMLSLYKIHPVFNIEQFAVTQALLKGTRVSTVADVIYHYWITHERLFMHAAAQRICPEFTVQNFERLVRAPIALGMPEKRLSDKVATALKSRLRGWDGDYRFADAAYRASKATKDADHAKVWRTIARSQVTRSARDPAQARKDFPGLFDQD